MAVNVALDVPVPIVTNAGTVTAGLPLDTLTLAGVVVALVRLTVQVALPGGVKVLGEHVRVESTGAPPVFGVKVRLAVLDAPLQVAVTNTEVFALTVPAALAPNVAIDVPAAMVTDAGTVTAGLPLDKLTLAGLRAALVRLTVHVEVPGAVNVLGVQVRLDSAGVAAVFRVRVAVLEVPFQVAVSTAEEFALTAAGALAVKVPLDAPVPIVTDAGTVTAAFPLDRLTLTWLAVTFVRFTVQVELPGGVSVLGEHVRLPSTGGAGALRVRVAVFDVPLQVAVNTTEVFELTAAAAVAVNVVLDAPVPTVTDACTVTAALPLDRLTLAGLSAALVKRTVHVELPGGVNVVGAQVRLDSTGGGGFRVSVAVFEVPVKVAVNTAEVVALTAAAALAVKVVLLVPVPTVTDAGTVTAGFPLDRFTLTGLSAALVKRTVQVELPGGVNVVGEQLRLDNTGTGAFRVSVAVLDTPFQVAVSTTEVFALTAAAALAVKVALDVPVPTVTDAGTVTAALPLDRLTLTALVVTFVRLTVQAELPGGVNVPGEHVRLPSTGGAGALRVRVAVFDVPFQVAVSTTEVFVLTAAAAVAVNVALEAPVPMVTDAGTVTAALPLDRLTLAGLSAALVRLTVQVEFPGGVNVLGAHVKLESTGTGAFSVSVAVFEVPLNVAVNTAVVFALTAAAALAVKVVLDVPVPMVTDAGTLTAGFPLDRLTLAGLNAALVRVTVQVELPGGVKVVGAHVRLDRTGTGAFRVSIAVFEVPLNVAVNTAVVFALTAAAALAVNVALLAPVPTVTEAGTVTAGFPLDRLTLVGLGAAPVRLTVQVELPGGVNEVGAHVKLESTGTGAFRVKVAVFEVPLNVAVNTAVVFALTAAAALAVNVVLLAPVPTVTDAGTVTAGFPLDRLTLVGLGAAPERLTVQVELPGGVKVVGEQVRLESVGAG